MPEMIEVFDEKTATEARELLEQGKAVCYSDRWRFRSRIEDPEELMKLIKSGLSNDGFPIKVEALK